MVARAIAAVDNRQVTGTFSVRLVRQGCQQFFTRCHANNRLGSRYEITYAIGHRVRRRHRRLC